MSMIHIAAANSNSSLTEVVENDIQPNAVDLKLDKVFRILPTVFSITEDGKKHRGSSLIEPDKFGWYNLQPGCYEVTMKNIIEVGEGEAGFVITRSTLNRNGVFLTSGLYDSGYHGIMAAAMHVEVGEMRIKQGTRIGQYLSFKAQTLHQYNGSYGLTRDGVVKADEAKYHG